MTSVVRLPDSTVETSIRVRIAERWAVVGALVLFTGAVAGLIAAQETNSTDAGGGSLFRLLNAGAYLFTFYVTARDRAFIPRGARRARLLNLLLLLAIGSVAWSSIPSRSLVRVLELVVTTWFAAYVSRRYTLEEQVMLLADALAIVLVLSIAAVTLFPSAAIMTGEFDGAWRGVFDHKNPLGRIAFLGCIVFGLLSRVERYRIRGWIWGITSLIVLVLSTSRSAMIGLLAIAVLLPLYRSLRRRGFVFAAYATGAILLPLIAGGWIYTHLEDVMMLLGRNLTLSGRTSLWFAVGSFIARRPLLGYGYNAFWQGMNGDSGYISLALRWEVPHAHNGLLELALDTGLIGVALFIGSLVIAFRYAARTQKTGTDAIALWPLLGLTFMVVTNLTETSLLRVNNTFWILYLVLAFGFVAPRSSEPLES